MKSHILALFSNFEEAGALLQDLQTAGLPGFRMQDVVIKSPIEHPELSEMLGKRPVYIQWFTLVGVLIGPITGLTLISSAESSFLLQWRGGIPVVPLPPNLVLTYEFFILSGVLMTVLGFFIGWKLPGRRSPLYNTQVSEDKVGVLIKADDQTIRQIGEILKRHTPVEIMGEPPA